MNIDCFFNRNFLFCSKAYKINIIAAVMLITTGFLYSAPVITLQDEISNKKKQMYFLRNSDQGKQQSTFCS